MRKQLPIRIKLPDNFLSEETRDGYIITEKMKKVWAVELDLFNALNEICEKFNLKLFADGGTVLGAVRHKGFIPWDDDMDFMMPRSDYEKLCKIAPKVFVTPYFFQYEFSDFGSLRGHGQLRNSLTTGMLYYEKNEKHSFPYNQGIFIDIFPFDGCPYSDEKKNLIINKCKKYLFLSRKIYNLSYGFSPSTNSFKRIIYVLMKPLVNFLGCQVGLIDYFFHKYEKNAKKFDMYKTEQCWNVAMSIYKKRILKSKWYSSCIKIPFEFLWINVPNEPEEYLLTVYGNWKTPIIGTSCHKNLFLDPEISYKDYLKGN